MRTDNEEISIDIDGTGSGVGGALPVEKPEPRVEAKQPSFFALVYTATFSPSIAPSGIETRFYRVAHLTTIALQSHLRVLKLTRAI